MACPLQGLHDKGRRGAGWAMRAQQTRTGDFWSGLLRFAVSAWHIAYLLAHCCSDWCFKGMGSALMLRQGRVLQRVGMRGQFLRGAKSASVKQTGLSCGDRGGHPLPFLGGEG